jgi:hypothetical protein
MPLQQLLFLDKLALIGVVLKTVLTCFTAHVLIAGLKGMSIAQFVGQIFVMRLGYKDNKVSRQGSLKRNRLS